MTDVLTTLAIENYRSLRRLTLPLEPLNLVVGANGATRADTLMRFYDHFRSGCCDR